MALSRPTYGDIHRSSLYLATEIAKQNIQVDKIIGIVRGGLIPATIISQHLDIKMDTVAYSSKKGAGDNKDHSNSILPITGANSILLVDDLVDSGHTMAELYDWYTSMGIQVHTAVIHYKTCSAFNPHFYHIQVPENGPWIVYPWEKVDV